MEISEMERGFAAAIEGTKDGLGFVNALHRELSGLMRCIECYCHFVNPVSRKFSLIVFRNWCRGKWSEIPADVVQALRNLVFVNCLEKFDEYEADERNLIANAQFAIFWKTFPGIWPSFWGDLVSNGNSMILLNFMNAFCTFTDMLSSDASCEFVTIKNTMREVQDDRRLLEIVVSCIPTNSEMVFDILASLTRWVSLECILNDGFMGMVFAASSEIPAALRVMQSIIERGMEPQMKAMVFQMFNIPNAAIEMIRRGVTGPLLCAMADLIEAAGVQIVDIPEGVPYFQVALTLLMNEDDSVAESVAPLIHEHVKSHPELITVILNTTYTRLTNYFDENESQEASFCELLFGIIRSCFLVDFDYALGWIVEICQTMDISAESTHCVTLLELLNEHAPHPEFLQYFEPLLHLTPPLSSQQARALSSYTKFVTSVGVHVEAGVIDGFFKCIANIAMVDLNPELTSALLSLVKKHTEKIVSVPELICALVGTLDMNMVAIGATIIRVMKENQFGAFHSCLMFLTEHLRSDSSVSMICLKFVKIMRYVEGAPHLELVKQFLQQIMPFMVTNDESQAMFIRTCFSSLEKEGLDLISACIPTVDDVLSITALSKTVVGCQNKETASQAVDYLLPKVISNVQMAGEMMIVNDEVVELGEMLNSFFSLVLFDMREDKVCAVSQFVNEKLQLLSNCLIANSVMNFAISLAKIHPNIAFGMFLASTLTFALSQRGFDPLRPGWSKFCVSLAKLHVILMRASRDDTVNGIATVLRNHMINDENIAQYLEILTLTSRLRKDGAVKFFSHLMRFRNGLM